MSQLFGPSDPIIGSIHDQLAHLKKIKPTLPAPAETLELLTREQLSSLIDTAFWASLRLNEGRTTCFCVSVVAPNDSRGVIEFATALPYDESQIAKLAPAVPSGGCLHVSASDRVLQICGFGQTGPVTHTDTITIDVWEPGTVRVNVGPFKPFAVLGGRSNSLVAGSPINFAEYLRRILSKSLPSDFLEMQPVWREFLAMRDLAQTILADGHGGIVLIVPNETGTWSKSLDPFPYKFATADTRIRDAIRLAFDKERKQAELLHRLSKTESEHDLGSLMLVMSNSGQADISKKIRAVAGLARVDGAIVITQDLRVLGFGAKITTLDSSAPRICMFRPEPGGQEIVHSQLEDLGQTRHQSAARFAAANKDAAAIVISQDRHISVMHWDATIDSVNVLRHAEWWV